MHEWKGGPHEYKETTNGGHACKEFDGLKKWGTRDDFARRSFHDQFPLTRIPPIRRLLEFVGPIRILTTCLVSNRDETTREALRGFRPIDRRSVAGILAG